MFWLDVLVLRLVVFIHSFGGAILLVNCHEDAMKRFAHILAVAVVLMTASVALSACSSTDKESSTSSSSSMEQQNKDFRSGLQK